MAGAMKAPLLLLFATLAVTSCPGQGRLNISPVPVTNGLTGTLADASIIAALYFGPVGTTESGLQLVTATPLGNGYATFGSATTVPGFPSGSSLILQIRAWSGIYPDYETAVGSGLSSTLVGKSIMLTATVGGISNPPPIPDPLAFPGVTIWPVPEPAIPTLFLLGAGILRRRATDTIHPRNADQSAPPRPDAELEGKFSAVEPDLSPCAISFCHRQPISYALLGQKFHRDGEKDFDRPPGVWLTLSRRNMKTATIKTTMTPMAGYVVSTWQRHSCLSGSAGMSS